MNKVSDVEGIGPVYAEKLGTAGITTTDQLLEKGATPQGRRSIAESSGISDKLILEWVGMVDMFRIKGVKGQFSELLKAAGVDTVVELAQRNAANLHAKLTEINDAKKLSGRAPTASEVEQWIAQAKEMPRVVTY
ncbi:MAG: DUF4332 domain-containing protein [Desulfuromonadales bacterium]|nr:MAG: DUF4332 domain-containing protein [Desulfuromonadales bacterium]